MPFKVIIIGGGLAGNLLALGLTRNNIDVQVYERSERHSTREGLQIRLTAPALEGMRTCLSKEQLMTIVKKFGPASEAKAEAPRVFHKDGKLLIDLRQFPAYDKNAPINRGLLRDLMADPLYDAGKLKYEAGFDRYEVLNAATDNEMIRVWLADGTHDDCDLLIGADGSYSKVNEQVGLNSIDYIPKHVAITAKCDLPTSRFVKMSKNLVGGPIMTWADQKSFFFGVYRPKKHENDSSSKTDNANVQQVAFDEDLSSCMVSLNVERHLLPPDLDKQSLDIQYDYMANCVKDWSPLYQEMIGVMRGAPLHIYRPRTAKRPPKSWRKKVQNKDTPELGHLRVWVLGDAMHAMLPPRGMGGNMAMLDAGQALPLIVDLAKNNQEKRVANAEIGKALSAFENEMIPRSFEWVKKSGGDNFVPIDTSTLTGRLFFIVMGYWLNVVCAWTNIKQLFSNGLPEDKTPEFNMY
ncbi:FAD binding domain-containing protein [Ilyonectria robusta]